MRPAELIRGPESLTLTWPGGQQCGFHHVWLRDNCRCPECLHPVTEERLLFTADIPADIAPAEARLTEDGSLEIVWPAAEGGTPLSQTEFDPSSGFRHLQDVYMEFDDILGRIRVLRGTFPGSRLETAAQSAAS